MRGGIVKNILVIFVLMFLVIANVSAEEKKPITENELHTALKTANPQYSGKAKFNKDKKGDIWGVILSDCNISDLSPLHGMQLTAVGCVRNNITDLSPLKGMELNQFVCSENPINDISAITGMPIWNLDISGTNVTDLTPLKGMELQMIGIDPTKISNGIEILRNMKSLMGIYTEPKKKGSSVRIGPNLKRFWEQYDKGDYKKSK